MEPQFFDITIAVLLIILTIALFLVRRYYYSGKRYILLVGLNESGKTLIYSQLFFQKHVTTYTSSQDNLEKYCANGKEVTVVDVPGFHSIRQRFFEKYRDNSKGIVYVVDSVTLGKNIRDAAMVLYNILIDPAILKNRPELLILCNKQDQTTAKGCNIVKYMLEKEINTLRKTQLSQLKQLYGREATTDKLGDSNKDFNFENIYCKVNFAESYAFNKNGSVNLDDLKKWIGKVTN
ncbi:signal recognition particle receptor subunit beta isoform X1 [Cylas formicarius]|uniref:signal recognition particle receptor subunit beta isoform X1 n=1 Tax=Cylas formicarius TaxID=197179 RepID=UPI002958C370|nr:signal recognition particle receptor subunit beta isoform X1 [Cylas formicarius]